MFLDGRDPLVLQQLPWPAGDVRSALPSPFRCRERPFSERVPGSGISRSSLVTTLDFHFAGRAKAGRTSQSPFPSRFSSAAENAAVLSLLRRNRTSPSTSPQPGTAVCPSVWERRSFLLGEVPPALFSRREAAEAATPWRAQRRWLSSRHLAWRRSRDRRHAERPAARQGGRGAAGEGGGSGAELAQPGR